MLVESEQKSRAAKFVRVHGLKTWPSVFRDVVDGRKPWEYRLNDRDYQVGEFMLLREFDPLSQTYSGRSLLCEIVLLVHGGIFGIPRGYVIATIKPIETECI